MNNYSKQLNKETLPEIVKSHSDHYQIYFMTIKFNRPYIKPDQPQLNRQDYDEYFNYFYRRLNKKSLYKSNQPNKTILFAFPEKSHFVISDKTEKQVSMPNHYHCVVLIPNQHDNRFRKRCIVSNNKELRYEISENLYDPYPMKYQYNQKILKPRSTDIQFLQNKESIHRACHYSTKSFLSSDFNESDFYMFVSSNSVTSNLEKA